MQSSSLPSHSPRFSRRQQAGFGLLEIIIAAAIVAVLSVAVFARANKANYASNVSQTMDDIALIGSQVKARFQATTPGRYTELGTAMTGGTSLTQGMRLASPLPENMPVLRAANNAITGYGNRFGGTFSIYARSVDGGTDNAIGFYLTQIPKDVCPDLFNAVSTTFNSIDGYANGGTTATALRANNGVPPNKSTIQNFCDTVTTNFAVSVAMR